MCGFMDAKLNILHTLRRALNFISVICTWVENMREKKRIRCAAILTKFQ